MVRTCSSLKVRMGEGMQPPNGEDSKSSEGAGVYPSEAGGVLSSDGEDM